MSDPNQLLAKAEKVGKPSSGFMKIFGSSDQSKYEEAADLCVQAATLFRLSKKLSNAGDCFVKAANYQINAGNDDEAANTFIDAYKCFKSSSSNGITSAMTSRNNTPGLDENDTFITSDSSAQTDIQKAAVSLNRAVEIFTVKGQFRRGANFKFELGELYENDLQDYHSAMDCYELAGDWYSQDQAQALTNKCYVKLANLKALDADYIGAAKVYHQLVTNSMGNRLSQWSLKEYYLKMALCQLAAKDNVAATRTLKEAKQNDSNFNNSRESVLLETLIDCLNEGDSEKLSQAVFEFDKFNKLDKWYTTILLKIKESITEAEDNLL
ncbi:hypothetical protein TPHA_0I02960 [Tetrapisispora phaffii CBS 4417]|uniref:Vesicular-fusion protein SEC17 n=1 Tax=Tetrapisispora phaffii (strain ATCC 24235 / CBS 4417 / NBRC 1672 / NRRL Y-8282 / UCD 70-5) TaxID=1071381 RepID=G8BY19_TETPH|nr:hypothetical protein TPHA_0I02960 [Tetrapisispora phaffii CBS 4417]CCE64797.1 hypothetical protein TPHA_0I02960 [Tetrapisispora phaffii CBS 4417]